MSPPGHEPDTVSQSLSPHKTNPPPNISDISESVSALPNSALVVAVPKHNATAIEQTISKPVVVFMAVSFPVVYWTNILLVTFST